MITNIIELRQWNKEKIIVALQKLGPCTRTDIAKETGLSMATCSGIFNEMHEDNEIIKVDHTGNGIGRPSDVFIFNNDYLHVLSLSIYKSGDVPEIGLAVSDAVGNIIKSRDQMHMAIATETIQEIVREEIEADSKIGVIGISIPGVANHGMVESCDIPELIGMDFKELLEKVFQIDVQVWNDMDVLTYYLYRKQQADIKNFAALFFPENGEGSYVGSGFIVDGHLLQGCSMLSGELWQVSNAFGITYEMQKKMLADRRSFQRFAAQMVTTICCTIDPSYIVMISNTLQKDDEDEILKYLKEFIPSHHYPRIDFRKEDSSDYLKAVVRRTIDHVFFKYSL